MTYTCHSGGCPGADMTWEVLGRDYGVKTIAYSYPGHTQEGANPYIMTVEELDEGWEHIQIAAPSLKRKLSAYWPPEYVKKLLCRNWFQVKNAERIYAIGTFETKNKDRVNGGTGWAVQMGIDSQKLVFFFDQDSVQWYVYRPNAGRFEGVQIIPLCENFAGVGTRDISDEGIMAIHLLYEKTFNVR